MLFKGVSGRAGCLGELLLLQERMAVVGNPLCLEKYQPLMPLG